MANADRLIEVFNEAKARPVGSERDQFLSEACQGEPALKQQVLGLLQAHEGAGDFLKQTLFVPLVSPLTEKPGDRIGRYKLLEQIGEGGCGVVYMAEQLEPVRRRVALKVIKLGMDTKQVIARFEAERQALAMMDHPNIAKVLDAGATDAGRPFFVMELVRGIKITDYCDQNNLPTNERLELFIQVCHAIQHAHQKGVIHRDIKPSNILVTLHDDVAVPKAIDFGIAKATIGPLTEKTLFTAFAQFMGTPAYMSPEQAQMSGLDIDTRADIYSLGVLLYELLTGNTPFDAKELLAAGLDEMRRKIREDEPAKPSTCLSTMQAMDLTTVARRRHTDPPKLMHLIRGDLDWLVMKCLEKDRTRRYETASALAMDLQRHLNDEPVVACPPTNFYRFQKLVRRNKLGFAAASAITAALVTGLGVSTWMFFKEKQAHQRAVAAERTQKELHLKADAARLKAEAGQTALLYWQAFDELAKVDDGEVQRFAGEEGTTIESAAALAARYDRAFKLLARAANLKAGCDWAANLADGPEMWTPSNSKVRQAMHAAQLRARVALLRGHPEAATQDLLAIFVLGRHVPADGTLRSVMLQIEVELQTVEFVATNFNQFSPESLVALAQEIKDAPPRITVSRATEMEKSGMEWLIGKAQAAGTDVSGDGGKAKGGLRGAVGLVWDENTADKIIGAAGGTAVGLVAYTKEALPIYDEMHKLVTASPENLAAEARRANELISGNSNLVVRASIPNLSRARTRELETLARLTMLKAAAAYKQNGAVGLKGVRDPFGDGPFELRHVDRGFELRSKLDQFNLNGTLLFLNKAPTATPATSRESK